MNRLALQSAFLCSFILAGPVKGRAQETANEHAQVAAVVDAFHTALAAGDSTAALNLLAEDAVILENGVFEDREHYRFGHMAGDIRFAQSVQRERGEIRVEVAGETAWAHSTSLTRGRMGEREIDSQGAELMVLTRESDHWKIRAIHWSSRPTR